ncbi:HEAT repeat domain-containing protein [Aeoliella sp.]|uniref:HEAT repeat domain-containing protein n=1 Tax=Aeoliella sp. TaxID=2795800 RepID=UPI003CCBF1F6
MADPQQSTSNSGRRRWLVRPRLSLRGLLILVTVACIGMFVAQQVHRHWRLSQVRQWVSVYVDLASDSPQPQTAVCPIEGTVAEQLELLEYGILHLQRPVERTACLKILAEQYPDRTAAMLLRLWPQLKHDDTRLLALHLLGVARDKKSVDLLARLMSNPDPQIRAAAADALGMVRAPSYAIKYDGWSMFGSPSIDSRPPILLWPLLELNNKLTDGTTNSGAPGPAVVVNELTTDHRDALEQMMLAGPTSEERTAAARALLAWPPDGYQLRVAEWGVWINDSGELKLAQSVIDEIPPFVHRTGNTIDSLKVRVNQIMIVTKPIIHITANRPMVVDLEVQIQNGRPWFAYPRPDDFNVRVATQYGPSRLTTVESDPPRSELDKLAPSESGTLDPVGERYPWLTPHHRTFGSVISGMGGVNIINSVGLRWQSVIVSPERLEWMQPPKVASEHQWWSKLRDVECSWVSSVGESERFLYYDGPSFAKSPLDFALVAGNLVTVEQDIFSTDETRAQHVSPSIPFIGSDDTGVPVQAMFIHVDGDIIEACVFDTKQMKSETTLTMPFDLKGDQPFETLLNMLCERGLSISEAEGLADCWREQFFATDGKRIVLFLSSEQYDQVCPIRVEPKPTQLVRVGLVLTELD